MNEHELRKLVTDMCTETINIGSRLLLWHSTRHNWSQQTFGSSEDRSSLGPLRHLLKEVEEAIAETDHAKRLVEYVDCLHLIFDAADRDGFSLDSLLTACEEKLKVNMNRVWPKPDVSNSEAPIEHRE